jgi:hypothetical protein
MKVNQNSLVLGNHQKSHMPLSHLAKLVCMEQPREVVCMEQPWQRQHLPVEITGHLTVLASPGETNMDRKQLWP